MKTWQVGPYHDDWIVIVHADTRGKAKRKGANVAFDDFTDMRATRLPILDDKIITNEVLIQTGFPETWEGIAIDYVDYILDCGCNVCLESLQVKRAGAKIVHLYSYPKTKENE